MPQTRCPCRTVFLSDVHLGTRECRAEYLLDFLLQLDCERLVLVGDMIDLWAMQNRVVWSPIQNAIVAQILSLAARGIEVIYIPGNHDEAIRNLVGSKIRGVQIASHIVHQTLDGRRFLVSHGDEFDHAGDHTGWLHPLGDFAYKVLLRASHWLDQARNRFGLPYWSLSTWTKDRIRPARRYIEQFEATAIATVREQGYDGYIGGHIHNPKLSHHEGFLYCNTGDWVENCTALLEDHSGHLHLIHWSTQARWAASATAKHLETNVGALLPAELAWLRIKLD